MGSYVPNTEQEQMEMLKEAGFDSFEDLFSELPQEMIIPEGPDIPAGMSELEVVRKMKSVSEKNKVYKSCFRGAGAYRHYIPSIVTSIVEKEEFKTAYTPYQAELSQGILQSIFEYQTMICELTGMDVSNASVYDGAVAAAEAAMMCKDKRHETVFAADTIHPNVMEVMKTYCRASNTKLVVVPRTESHLIDADSLRELLEKEEKPACFYMQQPNFYGLLEEPEPLVDLTHQAKAKFIMGCEPTSLGILKTPGEYGADIAVGEGQPLGIPLSFGGPYLGYMAAKKDMMRKLPGRIVGETTDADGKRAFVLTLQAREQHIRRDKASSNICSNEALCALTASVYMAAMGPEGIAEVARQSAAKAHYLAEKLCEAGLEIDREHEFFNEFVAAVPRGSGVSNEEILRALEEQGILGGLPLWEGHLLWCATELNTRAEIEEAAGIVTSVLRKAADGKEA
ncbi:aminomethyl-transferring glycine dehydrogenase subunit GcvPA [Anaerovorax odorimutans]|uniref:Probable glycine dehydrogenase (decarboxylating) subunit 1 n=1 Tax=Anaerovorax odorimutans TaxID=109327 RepID=A0ABT1RR14_9FIRM|nr:aminomethyl-transferring glycine dehydrogenase subunit GcvPA [Anaerovorax odorimutans]MCQ4637613.1 aminomethyl-transferring glycine dehydrogenase subunit GcvPA [Anaerovorax odorimutans]